ncbi:UNVERIFIED_CONTAM: hypothetical protein GTU68_027197 [Idotea baltica]|nr:hypothetical protein [Idotea baltica]
MKTKKLKVLSVVGTRPEIIRLSRVLAILEKSEAIEHVLVHTGQNYDYELNEIFFQDLDVKKPDHFLNAAGETAINTIGNIISAIEPVLNKDKPDAFLVLGDTNSCLCAIPAKRLKIPIFHMEAGNRCFDLRVPEEINRRIVDHVSDINLTYSSIAREYLLREGLSPERVIKTGSPMFEVLNFYKKQIDSSDVCKKLNLEKGNYFVVSSHRAENVDTDEQFLKIVDIINTISEQHNLPVIISTHPRTRNRPRTKKMYDQLGMDFENLLITGPMSYLEFIYLIKNAMGVITDSGGITEETTVLGIPCMTLRNSTERPETVTLGTNEIVGTNPDNILPFLEKLLSGQWKKGSIPDLWDGKTANRIVKLIAQL